MEHAADDLDWHQFRQSARHLTGIDLTAYRPEQMRRRLGWLLARNNVNTFAEYLRLLRTNRAKIDEFRDFVTINVSEFYRDPKKWDQLATEILKPMLVKRRPLRIWSAGCSIGAEPYTVALLLRELDPYGRHDILGTDIDRAALERAQRGDGYTALEVRSLTPERLARFFVQTGSTYAVRPELRELVRFEQHDLLSDPMERNFDLILCRNVVIYFTEEAKGDLYRRFHDALRPGGVLFVGGTEVIYHAREIGFESGPPSFYRRVA